MKRLAYVLGALALAVVTSTYRAQSPSPATPAGAIAPQIDPVKVTDWGVKFDGVTDDTAAWNAMVAATPNATAYKLPVCGVSIVTDEILLYSMAGRRFFSEGSATFIDSPHRGAEIRWKGPLNADGTPKRGVFYCNCCNHIEFERICISTDDSLTPPSALIAFDQVPDPGHPPTITSTNCFIEKCVLGGPRKVPPYPCYGVSFAKIGDKNTDFGTVRDCVIQGANSGSAVGAFTAAVYVGPHFNSKGHYCENVAASYCTYGFQLDNGGSGVGSCHFSRCRGTGNGTADYLLNSINNPVTVEKSNFEQTNLALQCKGAGNGPLLVTGNRWACQGSNVFDCIAHQWLLQGNTIGNTRGSAMPPPIAFVPHTSDAKFQSNGNLFTQRTTVNYSDVTQGQGPVIVGPLDQARNY